MSYRDLDCPNCGRRRVAAEDFAEVPAGVCEKCKWDMDNGDYLSVTRSEWGQQADHWEGVLDRKPTEGGESA